MSSTSSRERYEFWQQYMVAWQGSGLSGAAFCKQHELNYAQFNYWRKKLLLQRLIQGLLDLQELLSWRLAQPKMGLHCICPAVCACQALPRATWMSLWRYCGSCNEGALFTASQADAGNLPVPCAGGF